MIMEVAEAKCSSGYGKPPWIFKGSALYQLHLVKADTARAFIPKGFRLVEAFGYTLGGFFLASYEDSPAGVFDELVVIAGIVWNPPTSCATEAYELRSCFYYLNYRDFSVIGWAARVLVSSNDACDHGRRDVGLPSQVAKFSKRITTVPRQKKSKFSGFLNRIGLGTTHSSLKDSMDVQVTEISGPSMTDICNINLTNVVSGLKSNKGMEMGPAIKMSLPSFSGCTEYNPNLLKYSCNIECRVRAVQPMKVYGPSSAPNHDTEESLLGHQHCKTLDSTTGEILDDGRNLSISVMLSRPILALEFKCLKMQVEAPVVVSQCSQGAGRTSLGVS